MKTGFSNFNIIFDDKFFMQHNDHKTFQPKTMTMYNIKYLQNKVIPSFLHKPMCCAVILA